MDAATFAAEAMRLERLMYRVSYSYLHSDADCADAVQEALLRAWQRRSSLRRPERFQAWLVSILINQCKDMLKRDKRLAFVALESVPEPMAPEDEQGAVRTAVRALPPDLRSAVTLYYQNGYSVPEIAAMLGVPEGTVKSRLHRARRRLSRMLATEWEDA